MPTATPSSRSPISPNSGKPRLLSGADARGTGTRTAGTTFTATLPIARLAPHLATPAYRPNATAAKGTVLPGWAKGFVVSGLLLAAALPASVLLSRSMLAQAALMEQSSSNAAMVCIGGKARALDASSLGGWLFGGSIFSCGDWETREARQQRDRDVAHNSYMAREKARQQQ